MLITKFGHSNETAKREITELSNSTYQRECNCWSKKTKIDWEANKNEIFKVSYLCKKVARLWSSH